MVMMMMTVGVCSYPGFYEHQYIHFITYFVIEKSLPKKNIQLFSCSFFFLALHFISSSSGWWWSHIIHNMPTTIIIYCKQNRWHAIRDRDLSLSHSLILLLVSLCIYFGRSIHPFKKEQQQQQSREGKILSEEESRKTLLFCLTLSQQTFHVKREIIFQWQENVTECSRNNIYT
jgi:hypothetical protein